MKKYVFVLFVLLLTLLFACDKIADESLHNLNTKWEATTFMSLESITYPKKNNYNPTIEFKQDGTFTLKPDVNSCGGNFSTKGNNEISISASACTEMCCDSQFSQKFIEMLPFVKTFSIESKTLKLYVPEWGWIVLQVVE